MTSDQDGVNEDQSKSCKGMSHCPMRLKKQVTTIRITKHMQAETCSGQCIINSRRPHHRLAVIRDTHKMKTEIRVSASQGKGVNGSRTSTKVTANNCEKSTSNNTGCMAQKLGRKNSASSGRVSVLVSADVLGDGVWARFRITSWTY